MAMLRIPAIVVSSPEAAKEVLKVHDMECCSRPHLAGSAKLSYNNLDFVREEEIDSLIDLLNQSSLSATPVDLSGKMFALTASITLRIAFGKSFGGSGLDNDRFGDIIQQAESTLGSFVASDLFPYLGWIIDRLTGLHAKFETSFHELDDFFRLVIDEHLNRTPEEGKEDLVDLLLSIERGQ
ncbi:Cytochrome P [Trema orientale]|uniref:Cytochrome P n=1 Tax=Trema orientale TaxID=63057 RepID=A0A2P5DMX5_TREOI|nr:Cytochrome P [Trema orientale]